GIDDVLLRQQGEARRHTAQHLNVDGGLIGARSRCFRFLTDETQRAALHVLTTKVAFALQSPQVIVDPVRRTDAHRFADLAEGRWVSPLLDRLADEIECLRLALGETLHPADLTERVLGSQIVRWQTCRVRRKYL